MDSELPPSPTHRAATLAEAPGRSDEPVIIDSSPSAVLHEPDTDRFIIQARGLTKQYGTLTALHELNLDVPRGSVFGIIGPNGAGKSTTFSIFATLLKPTSGAARVCGADPTRQPKTVRRNMGYMPDVMGVYERLTVKEYLEFHAAAYRVPNKEWPELVNGLLELVDLDVKSASLVDDLSRGMKQRLSLARAMVHDPELLILDEPASGLDPRARIEFRELLEALRGMGKSILISSHILSELQQMCTDIAVDRSRTPACCRLARGDPGPVGSGPSQSASNTPTAPPKTSA